MTKAEAAQLLGVSEKTVQNYVSKGRLSVEYKPGKTSPIADFDEAEVQALKLELQPKLETMNAEVRTRKPESQNVERGSSEAGSQKNGKAESGKLEPGNALALPTSNFQPSQPVMVIQASDFPQLAQALVNTIESRSGDGSIALADKIGWTVKEAATATGLSEKMLRDAIKGNELRAIRMGRADRLRPADVRSWYDSKFDE